MIENKGDLISRSELIKAFNEAQVEFDEYYKGLGKAKVITDNAPTVEVPTYTDLIEANKEGYNNARRLYERPKGELVKVIDYSDEYETRWHYECSKCKNAPYYCGEIYTLHFCPNCGADMRGIKE